MDKFYKRNIPYKLVSFLLAVLVWVYVTNELNPADNLVTQVPLEPVGLKSGLAILEMPAVVKVRLQGKRNVVSNATNKEIRAFINLSQAGKGENLLPVEVVVPSGFQVVEKNPAKVTVVLDEVEEKQVPVRVMVNGRPVPGYRALPPLFEPTQVRVKGPQKIIKEIDHGEIIIDIQGRSKTTAQVLPVLLYSKENHRIEASGIRVKPANIDLTLPVVREKEVKLVPVEANLVGQPAEGFGIASVVVEPKDVYLQGGPELLEGIRSLSTGEINVSGAKEDLAREVPLLLPEGTSINRPKTARVFIQIIPQPVQKTFYPVPVKAENVAQGLKATLEPKVVNVTLEGKLETLSPEKIRAFVDLQGFAKGSRQVNVQVAPLEGFSVVSVEPHLVTVTLE